MCSRLAVLVYCKKNTLKKVQNILTRKKFDYETIKVEYALRLTFHEYSNAKSIIRILLKKKMIKKIKEYHPIEKGDAVPTFHIFFDIDSTLTHKGVETINKGVRDVFRWFANSGHRVYFCTGRKKFDVQSLISDYNIAHGYGIAEGGGIIVGIDEGYRLGNNYEVNVLKNHLRKYYPQHREDIRQPNRITEYVVLTSSIRIKELNKARRDSEAKVEFHFSKNSCHISKKGVNKGAAIMYLTEELKLGTNDKTVGVGDSDLDIPMFKVCDQSYAVKNASKDVKKAAKYTLRNSSPKAIYELFERLCPRPYQ